MRISPSMAASSSTRLDPLSVLVADDETSLHRIFERVISQLGLDPVLVDGGIPAVAAVATNPQRFGCVILDITMPDLSGIQAAEQIHSMQPDLPIILTSGWSSEGVKKDLPFAAFLAKPFRMDDIRQVLQHAIYMS